MRIDTENSDYGSDLSYVIAYGVVRDIVHQEAEWDTDLGGGGAKDCPNIYCHIVLTLPANCTFYTYKVRLMFVQSQQARNITDLSAIKLTASINTGQTENGTSNGYPVVSNVTGVFSNFSAPYTPHHWAQLVSGTKGIGIMFTDAANQELYAFDSVAGTKTGGLRTSLSQGMIEVLPVTLAPVQFTYALDKTWEGAVVTFDSTTSIYKDQSGTKTGLWILVESPPIIETMTES